MCLCLPQKRDSHLLNHSDLLNWSWHCASDSNPLAMQFVMHSLSVSLTEEVAKFLKHGFMHLVAVSISNFVLKFCTRVTLTLSSYEIL